MLLYDNPVSSNALKVRFLLAELGLGYDRHEVPMLRPRPAEYVAINPLAGIPTLDDDGFVVTESNAILRYLALRAGREDLYPTEPRGHARVNELLDRFALTIRPAFFKHEAAAMGFKFGIGFGGVPNDPDEGGRDRRRHRAADRAAGADPLRRRLRPRRLHDRRLRDRAGAVPDDEDGPRPVGVPQDREAPRRAPGAPGLPGGGAGHVAVGGPAGW